MESLGVVVEAGYLKEEGLRGLEVGVTALVLEVEEEPALWQVLVVELEFSDP